MTGGRSNPLDKNPGHNPLFSCRRIEPVRKTGTNPLLPTLSDPRGGVLTLTDPRTVEKYGVITYGSFVQKVLVGTTMTKRQLKTVLF